MHGGETCQRGQSDNGTAGGRHVSQRGQSGNGTAGWSLVLANGLPSSHHLDSQGPVWGGVELLQLRGTKDRAKNPPSLLHANMPVVSGTDLIMGCRFSSP